ncbi:MAG TPA: NADH-quinone oxidoreductase subunit F [Persephonella sp.]|uniref:NADH-quinone oxidoreductase subunit f (Nadhdehydrogenase i subunit f) (Ndh-1 subunit f) n=1 Tax=Persephonella marina (strain DSM 14350 / EX-H1) TaxID=123214 RepID=C0QQ01_PERMH|nr:MULTISPECIES: NADH-ubiquinone oxidoreductase-F iron-sulfur binding region domain-containing protein [Persephonella]ACO04878.1 NADH-quinone oxidoreductase subunit f (nadhdehydrogenase i subunit f) (ndh-1 subunit f) [Persephonella marina EX-H1]HCB69638.1 NADH-quinone oxidoreductase subunit F [Persephonella sp.]
MSIRDKIPHLPEIHVESNLNLLLRRAKENRTVDIEEYVTTGGYSALRKALERLKPEDIVVLVEESTLRGRGGAGFPTARKWRFALMNPEPRYLICNCDESEPGTFKDRIIVERDPHLLLEGMIIAGYALGAKEGYIYIRGEYPAGYLILENAIEEAKSYGFLGENILGTNFSFDIKVYRGAGAYICGEETALIESLEGKRGHPRLRPPYPAQVGIYGKPTVVNNVETLSNIPIIVTYEQYFMNIGPSGFYGPKLFPISGKVEKPGVYEATMDITLRELIDMAGGIKNGKRFKAVFSGALGVYSEKDLDMPMDYSPKGFGGTGTTIVLDEDDCIIDSLLVVANFFHHESCGKCTPCRVGTYEQMNILKKIKEGRGTEKDLEYLKHLSENIPAGSICGLGFSAPQAVSDALRKFPEEFEAHLNRSCKVCFPDSG